MRFASRIAKPWQRRWAAMPKRLDVRMADAALLTKDADQ
jgi:hypothetical protein